MSRWFTSSINCNYYISIIISNYTSSIQWGLSFEDNFQVLSKVKSCTAEVINLLTPETVLLVLQQLGFEI